MLKTLVITGIGLCLAVAIYFFAFNDGQKDKVSHTNSVVTDEPVNVDDGFEDNAVTAAVTIGDKAPNFKAASPEGEAVSLNDVLAKKGKVTIVEFWASWCPYCQAEMPNVSRIYKKYHDKGLEIISVSIDQDRSEWLKGIKDLGMADEDWVHISNLNEWDDPIIMRYGVSSIPTNYILDADGKVVAIKLKDKELEQQVAKMIGETEE